MAKAYSATTVLPAEVCAATSTECPAGGGAVRQAPCQLVLASLAQAAPASRQFTATCWKGSSLKG